MKRFLTTEEKENLKNRLISKRSKGDSSNPEEDTSFLEFSPELIREIEESADYVNRLTRRHMADLMRKEKLIWDALYSQALAGDPKCIKLYFELTGRLKTNSLEVKHSQELSIDKDELRRFSDEDLTAEFKEIYGRIQCP